MRVRVFLGTLLIKSGMAIIPRDVRGVLMYHVPGALTESEKVWVRAARAQALAS